MINIKELRSVLKSLYTEGGPERCGFILPGNKLVEVKNTAPNPEEGFQVSPEDFIQYMDEEGAIATWHTHPNYQSNISGDDYIAFKAFSDQHHFIIGNDGVRCYKMDMTKKAIMEVADE